jgi:MarR family transcriptional regulator, lower aerobic nicotinate degradation pathway regulator
MTVQTTEILARPVPRLAKELVKSSGFLLAKLGLAFKAKAVAKLEEAGFDPYHYSVLAILGEGARETQAMIADSLALDPSRLVALLDSLEERELVDRQRDPEDRRRHVVTITAAGKQELSRLRAIVKEVEDDFLAPLDAKSRQAFHETLQQLACHHDPRCAFRSPSPD